jgi:2-dehydropantoate 2-reductase
MHSVRSLNALVCRSNAAKPFNAISGSTRQLGAFKTSMLQDAEAGRGPLEVDALVASVREIGQHVSVPTPQIDALLGLVRLHAQTRGLY